MNFLFNFFYFVALYARDIPSNNETSNAGRKRSRFDEGGGEFGRDSREDRDRDIRGRNERADKEQRHERNERYERSERESKSDRYERSNREREHRDSRDTVERRDSREHEHRDIRDDKDREHADRDREYKRQRDDRGYESRDRERERERESDRDRDRGRERERERERDRNRESESYRERDRRDYRDTRDYRDYRDNNRRPGNNIEIPFDQFLRLSPWRGPVTPLEERPRHLKNWDAAPSGFERISADKAKLTGLFPPPGNIAKSSNYVPPTLDPARAAMFQLLNKDNNALPASASIGVSDSTVAAAAGGNLPANLLKQAKRFYVGNLPVDCSESTLMNFMEMNLRGLSGTSSRSDSDDSSKVLSINVSNDRSYAFIECRTAEDASLAMNLDGVIFEGSQLKIRRPKEYHLAMTSGLLNTSTSVTASSNVSAAAVSMNQSDANSFITKRQLIISGIPEILTADHLKSLLSMVTDIRYLLLLKDRETDKSLGVAVFEFVEDVEGEEWSGPFLKHSGGSVFMGPFEMKFTRVYDILNDQADSVSVCEDSVYLRNLLSVYNLQPGYATSPSSTQILQLLNIVTKQSLETDYDAIYEDIRNELIKFDDSSKFDLIIPKPGDNVPGVGKVFVKFGTVESAARAASELAGRIFDGHTCIVSFFPIEKFEKRIF